VTSASRDQKLNDRMIELKRHLRTCARCISAKKAAVFTLLCPTGLRLTVNAALLYDDLIRLKVAAHNHPGNVIFACPDLSKHGASYSLTAYPYIATGIQDTLF
jgi:hypothetical protein